MASQILRSDVVGYLPASLAPGELFYNSADNVLYIGESDYTLELVSNDPGTVAAAIAQAEADLIALQAISNYTIVQATEPDNPNPGDQWYDTLNKMLMIWNGSAWATASPTLAGDENTSDWPVTVAQIARHLKLGTTTADEDTELFNMMMAATHYCETIIKKGIALKDHEILLDNFPPLKEPIYLPQGSETDAATVGYWNSEDVWTVLDADDHRIVTKHGRSYIHPAMGTSWPTDCNCEVGSVTVMYLAGNQGAYTSPIIKQAVLLIIGALYENREDSVVDQGLTPTTVPLSARRLLSSLRTRY